MQQFKQEIQVVGFVCFATVNKLLSLDIAYAYITSSNQNIFCRVYSKFLSKCIKTRLLFKLIVHKVVIH